MWKANSLVVPSPYYAPTNYTNHTTISHLINFPIIPPSVNRCTKLIYPESPIRPSTSTASLPSPEAPRHTRKRRTGRHFNPPPRRSRSSCPTNVTEGRRKVKNVNTKVREAQKPQYFVPCATLTLYLALPCSCTFSSRTKKPSHFATFHFRGFLINLTLSLTYISTNTYHYNI